jgi:hypothetical protein
MSGLSTVLGKTAFSLIEIMRMYFDTSLDGDKKRGDRPLRGH